MVLNTPLERLDRAFGVQPGAIDAHALKDPGRGRRRLSFGHGDETEAQADQGQETACACSSLTARRTSEVAEDRARTPSDRPPRARTGRGWRVLSRRRIS